MSRVHSVRLAARQGRRLAPDARVMTLSLETPGDLLAAIPDLLGYAPRDSVVVVGIGRRGEVSPVVRADVDVCESPSDLESLATKLAGLLLRAGAAHAVVAVFDRDPDVATRVLSAVREQLAGRCDVADGWVVVDGRYWAPECADTSCCPTGGRRLPPPPARGLRRYARAPHAGAPAAPAAPAQSRKRARAAMRRAAAHAVRGHPDVWRLAMLGEWRTAVAAAARGELPSDAASGRLIGALSDVAVRDAVVVDLVPGEGDVAEALCEGSETDGVREALSRMIGTERPQVPPMETLAAVISLTEHLAWVLPEASAPSHTVAGLCRWWRGDDEAAAAAVIAALQSSPGYRLAELLACALDMGMRAGWQRAS